MTDTTDTTETDEASKTLRVTIYGYAHATAKVDAERWEQMSDAERMQFAQQHFGDVTPDEASSYEATEQSEPEPERER